MNQIKLGIQMYFEIVYFIEVQRHANLKLRGYNCFWNDLNAAVASPLFYST